MVTPEPDLDTAAWQNMTRTLAHYERLEQIGEGTYGQVYRARCRDTGRIVAMKKMRIHHQGYWGMPLQLIREIKILKRLQHPRLLSMIEVVTSKGVEHLDSDDPPSKSHEVTDKAADAREAYKGNLFLVLEYIEHDLTGLIDVAYGFTDVQIKCIFRQLLEALSYMHENKYVHRDIKSSNVLISSRFELKLADFGLARCIEPSILEQMQGDRSQSSSSAEFTNKVITLWYRPPEILLGASQYGPKVDVWSAGCILAELLIRKPLFAGKTELEQFQLVMDMMGTPSADTWDYFHRMKKAKPSSSTSSTPLDLPALSKIPEKPSKLREKYGQKIATPALNLLEKMLEWDPRKRLTAANALQNRYFWTPPTVPEDPTDLGPLEVGPTGHFHEFQTKKKRKEAKAVAEQAREQARLEGATIEEAQDRFDDVYRRLMKKVAQEGIHALDDQVKERESLLGSGNPGGDQSKASNADRYDRGSRSRRSESRAGRSERYESQSGQDERWQSEGDREERGIYRDDRRRDRDRGDRSRGDRERGEDHRRVKRESDDRDRRSHDHDNDASKRRRRYDKNTDYDRDEEKERKRRREQQSERAVAKPEQPGLNESVSNDKRESTEGLPDKPSSGQAAERSETYHAEKDEMHQNDNIHGLSSDSVVKREPENVDPGGLQIRDAQVAQDQIDADRDSMQRTLDNDREHRRSRGKSDRSDSRGDRRRDRRSDRGDRNRERSRGDGDYNEADRERHRSRSRRDDARYRRSRSRDRGERDRDRERSDRSRRGTWTERGRRPEDGEHGGHSEWSERGERERDRDEWSVRNRDRLERDLDRGERLDRGDVDRSGRDRERGGWSERDSRDQDRDRGAWSDRGGRDRGDWPDRGRRDRGDWPERDGRDRGEWSDRGGRDRGDWPERDGRDRGERSDRGGRDRGDWPERDGRDRGEWSDRGGRDRGEWPERGGRDRVNRDRGDRHDGGDRDRGDWQPRGGRNRGDWRDRDDRDRNDRYNGGERGERHDGEERERSERRERGDRDRGEWRDHGERGDRYRDKQAHERMVDGGEDRRWHQGPPSERDEDARGNDAPMGRHMERNDSRGGDRRLQRDEGRNTREEIRRRSPPRGRPHFDDRDNSYRHSRTDYDDRDRSRRRGD